MIFGEIANVIMIKFIFNFNFNSISIFNFNFKVLPRHHGVCGPPVLRVRERPTSLYPRDLKFVAHDATIAHDFISNKALYIETLQHIVNNFTKPEVVEEARGYLKTHH